MLEPRRRSGRRVRGMYLVGATLTCLLVAGCGPASSETARWSGGTGAGAGSGASTSSVEVTFTPSDGATNISPTDPVTVTATGGTIQSVVMTNPDGKQVKGALAEDTLSWKTAEPLGYDKTYTINVEAVDTAGKTTTKTSRFTTVKPGNMTLPYLRPDTNGGTFGIGEPIVVRFDEPIPDRSIAEKALRVTTNPPVEGRWHWFDKQELHWRPAKYWTPGTKVSVQAKVYGVNFGGNLWGQADRSISFTIGRSKIARADNNTHHMLVYIDGKQVRDIPVSMGMGGSTVGANGQVIDFWTRSGPHVVLDKQPVVRMSSASYGITDPKSKYYYDEDIKLAVHISYAGEYVHLADWNIWAHGYRNTSHGCINVGPANAQWFYDTFGPGDVVEVTGSPKTLNPRDGLGDWVIPWSQW